MLHRPGSCKPVGSGSGFLRASRRRRTNLLVGASGTSKMSRLLELRRSEFEALPAVRQQRLKSAFAKGDPGGRAFLDADGLHQALRELGLEGHSKQERAVLKNACTEASVLGSVDLIDFAFVYVPKVDMQLQEVRSPKLLAQFSALGMSDHLTQVECWEAMLQHSRSLRYMGKEMEQLFWRGFERDFPEVFQSHARYGTPFSREIDFSGYQALVRHLRSERGAFQSRFERQAAVEANLTPQAETAHYGEIFRFWRIFASYELDQHKMLSGGKVFRALIDCGILPLSGEQCERTRQRLDLPGSQAPGPFAFVDFLQLVRQLREEAAAARQARLLSILRCPHWHNQFPVACGDVPWLLSEAGLGEDLIIATADIPSIVEECSREIDELHDLDELVSLSGYVVERAHGMAREREATLAKELGFSREQVAQLYQSWAAFAHADSGDGLDSAALGRLLRELNPAVRPTPTEIEDLMVELTLGPGGGTERAASEDRKALSEGKRPLHVVVLGMITPDFPPGADKPDAYCTVEVEGKPSTRVQSQVVKDALEPIWGLRAILAPYYGGDSLVFNVYDQKKTRRDVCFGMLRLPSEQFHPAGMESEELLSDLERGYTCYLKIRIAPAPAHWIQQQAIAAPRTVGFEGYLRFMGMLLDHYGPSSAP